MEFVHASMIKEFKTKSPDLDPNKQLERVIVCLLRKSQVSRTGALKEIANIAKIEFKDDGDAKREKLFFDHCDIKIQLIVCSLLLNIYHVQMRSILFPTTMPVDEEDPEEDEVSKEVKDMLSVIR